MIVDECTYLPKPDDHAVFITVLPAVIRVPTPIIDVNLTQATHKELNGGQNQI